VVVREGKERKGREERKEGSEMLERQENRKLS